MRRAEADGAERGSAGGAASPERPPADRPAARAWAGRALVALGLFAGVALVGRPAGAGLTALLFAIGLVAARGRRAEAPVVDLRAADPRRRAWSGVWWVLAGALACVPAVRAAGWVVAPAVIAAGACGALAVAGGRRWAELGAAAGALVGRLPAGAALAARASTEGVSVRGAVPAARGAALAGAVLAVFVPLLVSADAAFAEILSRAVPTGWTVAHPAGRVFAALAAAAGGGALLHAGSRPPAPVARAARGRLGRLEWALPLGTLVVLLAGFVALQLATLFGGQRHVLDTAGLTYAEYARSGFAQLLAVAALVLAVIAASARWARDGGGCCRVCSVRCAS